MIVHSSLDDRRPVSGVFIYKGSQRSDPGLAGVNRKLRSQLDAFRRNGVVLRPVPLRRFSTRISSTRQAGANRERVAYLRFFALDPLQLIGLVLLRVRGVTLFVEVATNVRALLSEVGLHPSPVGRVARKLAVKVSLLLVSRLAEKLFVVASASAYERLWAKSIRVFCNGVTIEEAGLPVSPDVQQSASRQMMVRDTIIAVGSMNVWHGFDRLIEGYANYLRENPASDVKVLLCGDGPMRESLEDRIRASKLRGKAELTGNVSAARLSRYYSHALLAVSSIGTHRIGIRTLAPLKNREYCLNGVPFAFSGADPDFDGSHFMFRVPANDVPVDVHSLLSWARELWRRYPTVDREMQVFARESLSWSTKIRPLAEDILARAPK